MSDLSHPNSPSPTDSESDGESAHSGYDPTYSSDEPMYPKRQRLCARIRKAAVDLITALPESLLLHVLSFLPIEDAVKTQVLSKRWLHLWTYSTSLVFLHDSDKSVSDFVSFVDRTLVLCNCTKLKKLGVRFAYEPDYASNVNLWTMFAMGKGAEELQLDFENVPWEIDEEVGYYLLPQLLYSKSSFKVLQFSKCNVMPKGVVCWNSLKKLSIGYAGLSEDVIQKILAGSPVLEILELYYFYGFNRLHISNASVKKLILRDFWEHNEEVEEEYQIDRYLSMLEVSAPHLHSLEILGHLRDKICRLGDVSSLVDANLNFYMEIYHSYDNVSYVNMLRGLLQSLVHVKKITLGTLAIQVLSIMEAKGLRSPLLNCEFLTLDTGIWKPVLPGIANMLESSPNLETLVITTSSSNYDACFSDACTELCNFDEKSYWTSKEKPFMCLTLHLHEVKFIGLGSYNFDFHLSFAQFLLKNARVLQKMVIDSKTESCNWPKEFVRAARKLLSFPRSSPNAVVLF
ncbi:hypothetical protein RHGRI_037478 [Rhododendron griersonianum]|uniref:F-box domain-containing protein n=1 Tax=Rhododendron griersonianum TaxID=479676 RepID=A0AAV6HVU4_9ERIC|nr:hypothetical protein RHGRI_037478 [Rhododendron griersonianum]